MLRRVGILIWTGRAAQGPGPQETSWGEANSPAISGLSSYGRITKLKYDTTRGNYDITGKIYDILDTGIRTKNGKITIIAIVITILLVPRCRVCRPESGPLHDPTARTHGPTVRTTHATARPRVRRGAGSVSGGRGGTCRTAGGAARRHPRTAHVGTNGTPPHGQTPNTARTMIMARRHASFM